MHQAVPDQAADVPAVRRAEEHEAAGSAAVPDSQQRSGMLGSQILKFRTQDLPLDIHPTNHPFAGLWSGTPVISGIPNLLSKFSLNVISD